MFTVRLTADHAEWAEIGDRDAEELEEFKRRANRKKLSQAQGKPQPKFDENALISRTVFDRRYPDEPVHNPSENVARQQLANAPALEATPQDAPKMGWAKPTKKSVVTSAVSVDKDRFPALL